MVVRHGQPAAQIEVTVEGVRHRGVQGDEAALPELRLRDPQDAIREHVGEPEIERFGDVQPVAATRPNSVAYAWRRRA